MNALRTTIRMRSLREVSRRHHELRRRLLDDRAFRLEQLDELASEPAPVGRNSGVTAALRIAASTALREIDDALDRMAEGTYGVCVGCKATIPDERLSVLPMTPLCTQCHFNEQNCRVSSRLVATA
jgi:RNA polymerase-binding transcription factor DksA